MSSGSIQIKRKDRNDGAGSTFDGIKFTFSPSIGPLNALVKIGCSVTIKAAIPVGIPIEIEKNTPPK